MLGMGRKSVVWVLGGIVAAALVVAGIWRYGITAFAFVMHHYQFFISLGALATALGAGIAAYQLRRKNRLTSVNFAAQALKEFAADVDMQWMFYKIEYGIFEYIPEELHESFLRKGTASEEYQLDKLLRHFAAVALAWKNGLVKTDDLVLIRYYVIRTMRVPEGKEPSYLGVKDYMDFVCNDWAKKAQNIGHPYAVLREFYEHLEESSDSSNSSGTAG